MPNLRDKVTDRLKRFSLVSSFDLSLGPSFNAFGRNGKQDPIDQLFNFNDHDDENSTDDSSILSRLSTPSNVTTTDMDDTTDDEPNSGYNSRVASDTFLNTSLQPNQTMHDNSLSVSQSAHASRSNSRMSVNNNSRSHSRMTSTSEDNSSSDGYQQDIASTNILDGINSSINDDDDEDDNDVTYLAMPYSRYREHQQRLQRQLAIYEEEIHSWEAVETLPPYEHAPQYSFHALEGHSTHEPLLDSLSPVDVSMASVSSGDNNTQYESADDTVISSPAGPNQTNSRHRSNDGERTIISREQCGPVLIEVEPTLEGEEDYTFVEAASDSEEETVTYHTNHHHHHHHNERETSSGRSSYLDVRAADIMRLRNFGRRSPSRSQQRRQQNPLKPTINTNTQLFTDRGRSPRRSSGLLGSIRQASRSATSLSPYESNSVPVSPNSGCTPENHVVYTVSNYGGLFSKQLIVQCATRGEDVFFIENSRKSTYSGHKHILEFYESGRGGIVAMSLEHTGDNLHPVLRSKQYPPQKFVRSHIDGTSLRFATPDSRVRGVWKMKNEILRTGETAECRDLNTNELIASWSSHRVKADRLYIDSKYDQYHGIFLASIMSLTDDCMLPTSPSSDYETPTWFGAIFRGI